MDPSITKFDKARKKTWFQFVLFTLMSLLTTLVDLGTFALFNYLIFTSLSSISFQWWLFDYSLANGGLTAFLAFALSFIISQTFNFFLQRKVTFQATNNVLLSGILYAVMVLVVFFLQLWVPTLVRTPLADAIGEGWADLIIKNVNMTVSFLIQFPVSKYVIMRVGHKKTA
jgi:putative flippase GtrA